MALTLVWFRQDLRIDDNPALRYAAARGEVLPVYLWTPSEEGRWAPGGASRWWLHHSLKALAKSLADLGSPLHLLRGDSSLELLRKLIRETGADAVCWNRRYEPLIIKRDTEVKRALREEGVTVESFNASLLFEPHEIATKTSGPYQVFTPFFRTLEQREIPAPMDRPDRLLAPNRRPTSGCALEELGLLPKIPWDTGFRSAWTPGEQGALARVELFTRELQADYKEHRDLPSVDGTSRLSPALHFGEIGPRRLWSLSMRSGGADHGAYHFRREVGWREFSHHLLYHFPRTPEQPLRPEFEKFPWKREERLLEAWRRGNTGYPIVDAGMRQLWSTGWMHNRVRMIAGSILVKHLLQPWHEGADWFWDTLVDADLAQNTLGWQWTAGCGADAAPYFRIFNPVLQGEKFDPEGAYVRRWVPELQSVPKSWIHKPWQCDRDLLRRVGVELGSTYPEPVISLEKGRDRALAAWDELKAS